MTGIGLTGLHSYKNDGLPNRSYVSNFNEENFKMAFLFSEDDPISHKNAWIHMVSKISLGIAI